MTTEDGDGPYRALGAKTEPPTRIVNRPVWKVEYKEKRCYATTHYDIVVANSAAEAASAVETVRGQIIVAVSLVDYYCVWTEGEEKFDE